MQWCISNLIADGIIKVLGPIFRKLVATHIRWADFYNAQFRKVTVALYCSISRDT